MRKVVPLLAFFVGIYWTVKGFEYGFWVRHGPGGGFFPVIGGLLTVVCSFLFLWQNRRKKASAKFTWEAFLPVVALLGMVFLSYLIGMILSMVVYIFSWLRFIEKRRFSDSLTISLGTVAVIYLIFVLWLHVPLPKGLLGLV